MVRHIFSWLMLLPAALGHIVAFAGSKDGYENWRWSEITHLGFWDVPNATVQKLAKDNGVRLFQDAGLPDKKTWANESARQLFAQQKAQQVKEGGFDGVFFDFEGNGLSKAEKAGYTSLAQAVTNALEPLNATLFVCVGGRPSLESRNYDYKGLAAASEFLFIMGYDMHFWDDYTCITKGTCSPAEAPIKDVTLGVKEYLGDSAVPAEKLVLGLPWYGQRYDYVVGVPWNMGQIDYAYIPQILDGSIGGGVTKKSLDTDSQSWKIDCNKYCWGSDKQHHGNSIWYDDAQTLAPKYAIAKSNNLYGVGMWAADKLPTDPKYKSEFDAMWDAIVTWDK